MHVPVLASEVLDWLWVREKGVYVDCTVGAGGHAVRIAERLHGGALIALDRDASAIELARGRLAGYAGVTVLRRNYRDVGRVLAEAGCAQVDGVLFDLGVSSMQIDDAARGFSFQEDGPLDMRMDPSEGSSAADLLSGIEEQSLASLLRTYGDVAQSRRIAAAIVRRRERGELATTNDLVQAVREALSFVKGVPEEVRTVFQAIRMVVNEELDCLETGLCQAIDALRPGGRVVCITFHSGEDRVVKNVFRDAARRRPELWPDGRVRAVIAPKMRILTPKPVRPSAEEVRANARAHSAKLRAAERCAAEEARE